MTTKTNPSTLVRNAYEEAQTGYSTWTNDLGYCVTAITETKAGWCPLATNAPQTWTHYAVRTPNGLVFNFRRHHDGEHVNTVRARAFRFVETGVKYGPVAIERYGDWHGWDRVKKTGHSTLEVDGKPMVIGSVTEIICPVYPNENGGVVHADCR